MTEATISPTVAEKPWSWAPDMRAWRKRLTERVVAWQPRLTLTPGRERFAEIVRQAAADESPWLYHPCVSAITHDRDAGRTERDIAFLAWVAANAPIEGQVTTPAAVWCWSTNGGFLLEPGRHDLSAIAGSMLGDGVAAGISFDPWCTILGYAHPDSWPASSQSPEEQEAGVRRGTIVALRAMGILRSTLPDTDHWLRSLAKVLIFLDTPPNLSRSSSAEDLPGIIFADTTSEIALFEVLVHEAAHHLLYLAEAGGPLIDPADDRLFASPLRADPRPLRGILLAYHALAFICAFYGDLGRTVVGADAVDRSDLAELHSKLAEAGETLELARDGLTPRGLEFVQATAEVAAYGR